MEKEEFLKLLPRLIIEDNEIKGAIITALSGVVATKEDIRELIAEFDKRFEAMDKRFEAMDKRFEASDKRFEAMQKQMDDRFNAMQKQMDDRFNAMDKKMTENHLELKGILASIQQTIGKPFEQFGRNVIIRLLEAEGYSNVKIQNKTLKVKELDNNQNEYITEHELDGFSLNPPIVVEITSILKEKSKIEKFLNKKKLIEQEYNQPFRGFFLAASSEFTPEAMSEILILLKKNNCELINL